MELPSDHREGEERVRFLILTEGRDPVPPDMAMAMMDMMDGWLEQHRASGALVDAWSIAGRPGGGGIIEVDSHEELDAVMAGFPFSQTSSVSVHALADLDASLANARQVFAAMMGGGG